MRILFDNNVPAPLRYRLREHVVDTAWEKGWAGLKNGELLRQAEAAGYDLLLTGDKNLAYQQNMSSRVIALVVLGTIRWRFLRSDTSQIVSAVDRATPGSFEALAPPSSARLPLQK